jgi:hypothetical protein
MNNMEVGYGRGYPKLPKWQENEQSLYESSCNAINKFVEENPNIDVSFIAFDSEPCYGSVFINFDTPENERNVSLERQDYEIQNRRSLFVNQDAWKLADYYLLHRQSYNYSPNTGGFFYSQYAKCQFPEWETFSDSLSDRLPSENDPTYMKREKALMEEYEAFLHGNVMLLFWRVFERLKDDGIIGQLSQSSPLRLGFNFHDQESITVLQILNL